MTSRLTVRLVTVRSFLNRSLVPGAALWALLGAGSAQAHEGHAAGLSFFSGLVHPLGGADHLLTALAVGVLAARASRAGAFALMASFLTALLAGGLMPGLAGSLGEQGIVVTSVVAGAALLAWALRTRARPIGLGLGALASQAAVLFFAGFSHGAVHAAQSPTVLAWAFTFGWLLASAALCTGAFALMRAQAVQGGRRRVVEAAAGLALLACGVLAG